MDSGPSRPTAQGELPDFHALEPIGFQGLCRDLYQVEPNISTAEVFGVSGQSQRGVDILAVHRNDDGISVGQCKRIESSALTVKLIQNTSKEFLAHIEYWRARQVRRFVLFVSPDTSRREINEEYLRQRTQFRELGIDYELWGQAMIVSKLRPHPGITRTYLRDPWTETICGTGVPEFPKESVLVDRVLRAQLEVLSTHVSTAAEAEIERLRVSWRQGKRHRVLEGVAQLRDPDRWQAFSPTLQASIARFEAQLALESDDLRRAEAAADEAERLDPESNLRIRALIARSRSGADAALLILGDTDDVDVVTLKAGLLLESGRIPEAHALLERAVGSAEGHRLRALAHVLDRDLPQARLEVEKAFELEPAWASVLYSKAIVYYWSGLSGAALPVGLPPWPEPEHWEFVKTDDESREFFKRASEAIAQIDCAEQIAEERRVYESWRLAAISNDPERRDEAITYCRELLERDPGHYRAVVWATARRLDVDLSQSVMVLEERLSAGKISVPEIVALVLVRIEAKDHVGAAQLLDDTRQRFIDSDAQNLWALWRLQIGATADQPNDEPSESQLVRLRAQANATGQWDELIKELQSRHDSGDGQATFELCRLLGARQEWEKAALIARSLMPMVSTAEALRLGSATLYSAGDYAGALQLLDEHRAVFPHGELPSDMRRLRLLAQRHLGMLPSAATEAEDLFRREPTQVHFSLLADVYFQKADFHSLAALARKHEQFTELTTRELLQLALRIVAQDRVLAAALWRRAALAGFPDAELPVAVEAGYRLGLDRELRTLLQRMMQLADDPGLAIRRLGLDELKSLLAARRGDAERVYSMYRAGKIPIHLLAQQVNRPVAFWYHRALLLNQASGRSDGGPTFTRHGWRTGLSLSVEQGPRIRLHADTTALLTAHHFGILPDIESEFAPIRLPHGTPIALAHMRDSMLPNQPARRQSIQEVFDSTTRHEIQVFQQDGATNEVASPAQRKLAIAVEKGWLLADFLPLADSDGAPIVLTPDDGGRLRTGHCLVDSLRLLGELSEEEAGRAHESLGPEQPMPSVREVPRGSAVLCNSSLLELLAAGGALPAATRAFELWILDGELDAFVRSELGAYAAADSDVAWLSELIDRINLGIQQGVYSLLPEVDRAGHVAENADESPSLACLLDLLQLTPIEGDAIWVDDRWATSYVHKDGAPILDTFDLLHVLRSRGAVSDSRFAAITHSWRVSDLRLIALSADELKDRTRLAVDQNLSLHETKELRTIRRQYARCLLNGADLSVSSEAHSHQNEWPYLLESGRAVVDSIVELWSEEEPDEVSQQRAEWLIRSVYVPDRGRQFLAVEKIHGLDNQLEATALVALLSHAISLASTDHLSRDKRRRYLDWIFERLIRRRMDADTKLAATIVDWLKTILVQVLGSTAIGAEHAPFAKAWVRLFVADLPDDLGVRLAEDPAFLRALDVAGTRIFRIGPHGVNADAFWAVAAEVTRSGADGRITVNGQELAVKLETLPAVSQLIVEDKPAQRHYLLLAGEVGLLSDSLAARESALRGLAAAFDLPRSDLDAHIARIAAMENAGERVLEVARLRSASAESHYRDLGKKVLGHESVEASDFLLEDVDALMRHLRLRADDSDFANNLDRAASELIYEVGLHDAIVRLAGIPRPLPSSIHLAIQSLSADDSRNLLGELSRSLCASPIGSAHVARLCSVARPTGAVYPRYVRRWARRAVLSSLGTGAEGWREVLRVCANELAHVEAFRRLSAELRLALVWAHGDRMFRILANAKASEEWIRDSFGVWSSRLPAEIVFADAAYLSEASHPQHIDLVYFALSAVGYVIDPLRVDDGLRTEFSQFIEAEPARVLALLQQPGWRPDSVESILRSTQSPSRLALLSSSLADRVSPATLISQVAAAVEAVSSGQSKEAWLVLRAVVNDQEVPAEFREDLGKAIVGMDLTRLYEEENALAILAAVFASQQAPRIGDDLIPTVREQLIALTRRLSAEPGVDDHHVQTLLSCPIYLYSSADSATESRFTHIAQLFEEMVTYVPRLADRMQHFVDRLVEGLPNQHARALWRLQVLLRALR